MDSQLETTPPGETVAGQAPAPGQAAVKGEPQPSSDRLAAILAKQASGQPLTHKERGFLGSVRRRGKGKAAPAAASENVLLDVPPAPSQPAKAAPAPADNPLFTSADEVGPVAESPAGALGLSAGDSAAVCAAAEALLDTLDSQTKIYIAQEARAAGCDPGTVDKYESAVALHPRNRDLMVKNSEPVVLVLCKVFRCEPAKLPNMIKNCSFIIGLGAHLFAVRAVVKSLHESRLEKEAQKAG